MRRFGIEHFLKKYSYFIITIIPEIRAANQTKAGVFLGGKKTHYEIAFARSVWQYIIAAYIIVSKS